MTVCGGVVAAKGEGVITLVSVIVHPAIVLTRDLGVLIVPGYSYCVPLLLPLCCIRLLIFETPQDAAGFIYHSE